MTQASDPVPLSLPRRLAAEFVGTALLVAVVVGSGIMAQALTADVGIQLLANSLATVFGLAVLIVVFGPVSGAHFNPVVTAAEWVLSRGSAAQRSPLEVVGYVLAQCIGGIAGALLANVMFDVAPAISTTERTGTGLLVGEVVATAGLVLVIFALVRSGRAAIVPAALAAWIGAAYWFTSSTSFANPAVSIGRMFSDTFAGIAPASVPPFLLAQVIGAALGLGAVLAFYPLRMGRDAAVTEATEQLDPVPAH
ncbi:aquaporin [Cellulomonas xylanilytica]|uniref:MIP family protein n=1 Tax=Cellulomonas xylanilytica TaxID=233583 RepID=A0A510UZJ5_9CELL|nr:MIP/aquaporin family protein [Cellulomonas xylanilytica]GEK19916.1 MIP family protein [Cellulomonas xylanilytica]